MKQKLFLTIIFLTLISHFLFSQQISERIVTGTVIGKSDNAAIIGVKIIASEKDNNGNIIGTRTNEKGEFSISIPEKTKSLNFSSVGYRSYKLFLNSDNSYKVILEHSETNLEALVVTGYQKIEKRKLTAAISKIDINEEATGVVRSIDQALAGQIAGLAITTTSGALSAPPKLRIRGTSSLNGTQEPLWVLDGLPLEGTDIPKMDDLKDIDNVNSTSIAGLNPADIESITVLKDAAATAIYGARAANGVIVITTKDGVKGKTKVNFSTRVSYLPNIDISRLNLLNSNEKIDLELQLLRSNFHYRENKGAVARLLKKSGEFDRYKQNGMSALSQNSIDQLQQLRNIDTDWNKILFRDAVNQEYNLSLSGGNNNASYYTSLGFYTDKGNVEGVSAKRLNILTKLKYSLSKRLKFGVSIFANKRDNKSYLADYDGFTNPVFYSRRANSYQKLYNKKNEYIYDTDIQGKGDSDLLFNIFEEQRNTSNRNSVNSISAIFDTDYRINNNLKITAQVGLQSDYTSIEKIAENDSYAMRKDKERAIRTYPDGKKYSFLPAGGKHIENENRLSQVTAKAMAEYKLRIDSNNELEWMAGTEVRRTWFQTLYSAGYGFDKQTLTTKPVIFPKEEDARYFPLHRKTFSENAFVSAFSTASYTLLKRYTLGGSIRFDGSDIFGVDKSYRYLPLYSLSGLWRISEEEIFEDLDFLNNLSIRASYGLQGNIDKNTSPFVMGYYETTEILPGNNENKIVISSPPNKKLRWEKTESYNAGLDLAVLNNAINVSLDYYYRKGTDLIGMQMLPLESGFSGTMVNWASMQNQGLELSIATRNIDKKNFKWHTNLNISYNNNKVLKESVPENQTTPSREGYAVGAIFAYQSGGIDSNGYIQFVDKKGEKVGAKEFFSLTGTGNAIHTTLKAKEQRELYKYVGSSDPLVSGGITNSFTFGQFELSANAIFNLGFYVKTMPSYSITEFDRGMNTNRDILDRWSTENKKGKLPALITSDEHPEAYRWFSDFNVNADMDNWVKRGDYLRLQSLRLAYKVPEKHLKKIGINSANIALEGRNLGVISADYNNFLDPETMGNPFAQPIPKTIILSLNLIF